MNSTKVQPNSLIITYLRQEFNKNVNIKNAVTNQNTS